MLYGLNHPVSLAVLLASFVVGLTLRGMVEALVARAMGDPRPRLEGRASPDPRRHLEPFGVVAALIGGLGWSRPVELQRTRSRAALVVPLVAGPAANVVLGCAALLAWRWTGGPGDPLIGDHARLLQVGLSLPSASWVAYLVGLSQLFLGVLALVPLPPLEGGRLLFGLAPRTSGWLRAEHQLVERNIGVAVLLALLLIPLGGPVPLLPTVLDDVLSPVVRALCG